MTAQVSVLTLRYLFVGGYSNESHVVLCIALFVAVLGIVLMGGDKLAVAGDCLRTRLLCGSGR